MRAPAFILRGLVLGCTAAAAWGQGQWLMIGRDLRQEPIELTQIEDGALAYVDRSGRARSVAVSELLAVVHLRPPAERPPRELPWITRQLELMGRGSESQSGDAEPFESVIELTDGQRWVGELVGGRGQAVTWLIEDTLLLDAPLEQIRSAELLAPLGEAGAAWEGLDDRVVLTNGDVLDGFVDAFGERVRFERGGDALEIEPGRVAGVMLANPPTEAGGVVLRTEGGSVITVSTLEITVTGQVSAEVGGEALLGSLGLRTTDLRSVCFAPRDFAGLASIEPESVSAPGEAPWVGAPRATRAGPLGVAALELRGPVRVDWVLPRPAARFAATAALPPAMWAWGDCEVVVRTADGREALRERLSAERPAAEISVPLGGMSGLTIEISAGAGGPVQDTIVLERPLVTWR